MIIFGFDCGIVNLGISIVDFNYEYNSQLLAYNSRLLDILSNKYDYITLMANINKYIDLIDELVSNVVKIKYINCVQLACSVEELSVVERINRLKAILCSLDQIAKPDKVLIEYQMGPNDDMRTISSSITMYYTSGGSSTNTYIMSNTKAKPLANEICYKLDLYSIRYTHVNRHIDCILVPPTLKNAYTLAPNGEYSNFIIKYTNKTANKKHAVFNFKYFASLFDRPLYNCLLQHRDTSLYDIADSFMMIYSYLIKSKYIK